MSTKAQGQQRLPFIDALRGLAVVFMVPLHTSHGWLRPEARHGDVWSAAQFFGGLAAPIFLTLAGVSLGLQWAGALARNRRPSHMNDVARGLRLVVLGYALRLQMWVIDGAAYARPQTYLAATLLLFAYGLAYHAIGQLPTRPTRALLLLGAALIPFAIGLQQVAVQIPERARSLLRVDVLQCIGASLVVLATVASLRGAYFAGRRFYLLAGLVTALLTSWTRSWVPGMLPEAVAGYLGQWTPEPGRPVMGLFPLFPWLSYALVGAALGLHWGRAQTSDSTETFTVALIALGAWLALVTSESWPPVYTLLRDHGWLIQPTRVVYRLGMLFAVLGVAVVSARRAAGARPAPLEILGRASLLIYWVHLEFAFGAAAHPLSRKLDIREWMIGSAVLLGGMWLVAYARALWPRLRVHASGVAAT